MRLQPPEGSTGYISRMWLRVIGRAFCLEFYREEMKPCPLRDSWESREGGGEALKISRSQDTDRMGLFLVTS